MASSIHLFFFSLIVCLSLAKAIVQNNPYLYIFKDNVTLQYYTQMSIGTPIVYVDVVIDLGGQSLWFDCENGFDSSSYRPVPCGSTKCKLAKGIGCQGCNAAPRPGCTNNTCGVFAYNSVKNLLAAEGLGEDDFVFEQSDGLSTFGGIEVHEFPFSCVGSFLKEGLASGTKGMIGLAMNQIALPTKLTSALNINRTFALCIPSSNKFGLGDLFIGGGPYYFPPNFKDMSKLLLKTPLIRNPVSTAPVYSEGDPSDEYFIGVKSIKIDGIVVPFNTSLLSIDKKGVGGTKLSTITPYTILHTSIYKALTNNFVKKAATWKISRVASVAPFGACFSSKTIAKASTGPAVPTIDLVLQSKSVYWRIYGGNSMVKVNKDVMCLGFIDGGTKPRTSIVIGGHQLEDNLLEFDLASSKLGFSSTLMLRNSSCSHHRLF